jgi:hypothetical protein
MLVRKQYLLVGALFRKKVLLITKTYLGSAMVYMKTI